MNKKIVTYAVAGAMALGIVGGVSAYQGIANAQTGTPATAVQTTANDNTENPGYTASIKVSNPQDNAMDNVNETKDNETQESTKLSTLAKITPEQAKAEALKVAQGTVTKVELDNENGNLVYSVDIKTNTGSTDVKVDAGNGKVLYQDKGSDNEKGKEKAGETEKTNAPDKDNIQSEQNVQSAQ
ncbi:PepSY domain-containing protein [Aceticella autotrophica]|uniref:PepSY domain-containing protein n=1 Tax=Aceticella autotrophica TaxID=2755338 RepID=A0A975AUK9_9THEO|nr:PepSY domain-containing protein [Aceticella autotrophica]QSZ26746.1 PepSY domain-containing protein [Aceticella autotrophica]